MYTFMIHIRSIIGNSSCYLCDVISLQKLSLTTVTLAKIPAPFRLVFYVEGILSDSIVVGFISGQDATRVSSSVSFCQSSHSKDIHASFSSATEERQQLLEVKNRQLYARLTESNCTSN